MLLLPLTLLALPLALASPTPSPLTLHRRQLCDALPTPGQNCAGAPLKDVIVEYPKQLARPDQQLLKGAVENSGGKILYDWKEFG
jgi:hypothetical protein